MVSAWERIWECLAGSPRRKPVGRKPRRLTLDQLEERTLLSVSPVQVTDTLDQPGGHVLASPC